MRNIKQMRGKKRIQAEFDKLSNDENINNNFGVDFWDPNSDNPDVTHWKNNSYSSKRNWL